MHRTSSPSKSPGQYTFQSTDGRRSNSQGGPDIPASYSVSSTRPARGSSTSSYYASQGPVDHSTTPQTPHAEGQRMSRNNQFIHTSTRSATYPRENTITQGNVYRGYSVRDLGAHSTLRPSQSGSSKLSNVYTNADVPVYCSALTASPKDVVFSSSQENPPGSFGDVGRQGYATQNYSKTDGGDLERGSMIRRKGASTFQGREKSLSVRRMMRVPRRGTTQMDKFTDLDRTSTLGELDGLNRHDTFWKRDLAP